MLDYQSWLDRAARFVSGVSNLPGTVEIKGEIHPPLSPAEVDQLAAMCRLPIPDSLRKFWTSGTSHSDLQYAWWSIPPELQAQVRMSSGERFHDSFWGGPEILSAREVVELSHHLPAWAEGMRPDFPKDARIWDHSLALIPVPNGDYVGLYVRDNVADPPVVYLCHEGYGGSTILAPNLDQFLQDWEKLGYAGIDFVMAYCSRDTDELAVSEHPVEVTALQTLLRGEVRQDLAVSPLVISEQDWLTARNPDRMLEWLEQQGKHDPRKVRLYCCACCRRVFDQLGDSGRRAVEVSERYADGQATEKELAAARLGLSRGLTLDVGNQFHETLHLMNEFHQSEGLLHRCSYTAIDAHWFISGEITCRFDEPRATEEKSAHANLVRHIFGNPFRTARRPLRIGNDVLRLVRQVYDGLPVVHELRAALRNAGEEELASHFQVDEHPKGCWALDLLLGPSA